MGVNVNCDAGLVLRIGLDYDMSSQTVSREIYAAASLRDALGTQVTWLHSPDNYQEKVDRLQYYGISYVDKTGILAAHWTVSLAIEKSYELTYHGGIEAVSGTCSPSAPGSRIKSRPSARAYATSATTLIMHSASTTWPRHRCDCRWVLFLKRII